MLLLLPEMPSSSFLSEFLFLLQHPPRPAEAFPDSHTANSPSLCTYRAHPDPSTGAFGSQPFTPLIIYFISVLHYFTFSFLTFIWNHLVEVLSFLDRSPRRQLLLLLLSSFSRDRLCHPIDGSPPRLPRPWDSPGKNPGVACHFLFQCMKVKVLVTLWTAAYQAPPSMGFSRQEYWSGLPLPSPP